MSKGLLIMLLAVFSACNNQEKKAVQYGNIGKDSVFLDSSFIRGLDDTPLDIFIKEYSDSLNSYTHSDALPKFLKDYYFDYNHTGIFSPFHAPISLRKLIVDKVDNCMALQALISSKDSIYNRKPGKRHGIEAELSELSFVELAKNRYRELNCK